MSADQTRSTPASTAMPIVQFADPVLRRGLSVVIWLMAAAVAGIASLAFWTNFEAILDFATHHGEQDYGWRVPLLVDTFVLVATLADLWCSATRTGQESKWQRVVLWWPKVLLAAAVAASFGFNVGHAEPDLGNRAVAAMPPVALVVSFELLMFITRRAIAARVAPASPGRPRPPTTPWSRRLFAPKATKRPPSHGCGDRRPAGAAGHHHPAATRTAERATNDRQAAATTSREATSAHARGATYRRVRELYEGGMTVAARIARELGVSSSYAQRTLRQVKADLVREETTRPDGRATATDDRADRAGRATSDPSHQDAARSPDHNRPEATVAGDHDHITASRPEATSNGDGRTTSTGDRQLVLVTRDQDGGEVEW